MPKSINPSGIYKLDVNGTPTILTLSINEKGELVNSKIGNTPVNGTYNSTTGKIEFAKPPTIGIFSPAFTGYVMPSLHRGKLALAGVFLDGGAVSPAVHRTEHGWFGEQSQVKH